MKILISGARGFIGRHLLAELLERGHELHALTRSLTDELSSSAHERLCWHELNLSAPELVRRKMLDVRPEACVHLAWTTEPGRYLDDVKSNLQLLNDSLVLMQSLSEAGCQQLIALGSCAEYRLPPTEQKLAETADLDPQTIYAASKVAARLLMQQLSRNTGTRFCWGRLFYLFGPGEDRQRLVPGVMAALLAGRVLPTSHGEQIKDYLYVKDAASAIATLLEKRAEGDFNICSGGGTKIRSLLMALEKIVGREGLIHYGALPPRAWDPPFVVGDSSRLCALGWQPQYTLESGLRDYYEGLIKNTAHDEG